MERAGYNGILPESKTGYKKAHWMKDKEGETYLQWEKSHKSIHATPSSKVNKIIGATKGVITIADAWRRYRQVNYYQGHQCLCGCGEVVTHPDRQYVTNDCSIRAFNKLMEDPEYRKEQKEKSRSWMKDPEKRQRCLEGGKKGWENCLTLPNKPELKMKRFLDHLYPDEYKYVGDGKKWIGRMNPDFISTNGVKQVIEVYGDYWHRGENPILREWEFEKYGYSCLVIWEGEINKRNEWKGKVREFHG